MTTQGDAKVPGAALRLPPNLYAHSLSGRSLDEWQRLDEHLIAVACRAAGFAESFRSADWAWNAGVLHDAGKAADAFQAYLRRENEIDDPTYDQQGPEKVNHSSAGAALAEAHFGLPGRVLAYIVAGHHAGLPDYYACDGGLGALECRLEEGKKDLPGIEGIIACTLGATRALGRLPVHVKRDNFHFWVRFVFSCLVDADFLDTEGFMEPAKARLRVGEIGVGGLKERLDAHLQRKMEGSERTAVNEVRKEVLAACRAAAILQPGLFRLTVPTGGGKTLSAMSFALDHALHHGKRRIIYVIPYTSIIEQTAGTLGEIFGADTVVEHHSNLAPEKETLRNQLASENWDAPIIITTNVQFFESLFAAKPGRCRKLHNLADSVVILDEAQLVPPTLLAPCVAALNELSRNYGVTVVLSTATQPALPELDPPAEIVPEGSNLYARLRRTTIQFPKDLNERAAWDELARRLLGHDQVLCIVNSRKDCHELHALMPAGTIRLSALMCGEHRSRVIRSIREELKAGHPLRVISTQLVEAGVDIDFPVVYRAIAGLDSIAQAAGRCNREGKLETGEVNVFVPPKAAPRGLLHKGESITRELASLDGFDPQSPETFDQYFRLYYASVNDTGEAILNILTPSDSAKLDVAFRSTAEKFKLIEDGHQRPVLVRYGPSGALLDELRKSGPQRNLMRKLQRYTVNVSLRDVEKMQRNGHVEEIWPGILAQGPFGIYDDVIGLDIWNLDIAPEKLAGV